METTRFLDFVYTKKKPGVMQIVKVSNPRHQQGRCQTDFIHGYLMENSVINDRQEVAFPSHQ